MSKTYNPTQTTKFPVLAYNAPVRLFSQATGNNPSFPGVAYIDNGYNQQNLLQVETNRENTATTYNGIVSPRATDSTPLLAHLGSIYYNPVGIGYNITGSGDTTAISINEAFRQIETDCVNIDTYLRAVMYTDLTILQVKPKYNITGAVASTVYSRYLIAMIHNSKVIFSAICKFRRFISLLMYYANKNKLLFSRADNMFKELQRPRVRNAWDAVRKAARNLPLHAKIIEAYSTMFNIHVDDTNAYQSTAAYVSPKVFHFSGETHDTINTLTQTSKGSLILSSAVLTGIENLPDLDELTNYFFSQDETAYVN